MRLIIFARDEDWLYLRNDLSEVCIGGVCVIYVKYLNSDSNFYKRV